MISKKNKNHWSKTKNGINAYINSKKHSSECLKIERERLSNIRDFEVGESVIIVYKKEEIIGTIKRVNKKTYGVEFYDHYVLINKESLYGYPNFIKEQITGDGRRYIGELCILKKING